MAKDCSREAGSLNLFSACIRLALFMPLEADSNCFKKLSWTLFHDPATIDFLSPCPYPVKETNKKNNIKKAVDLTTQIYPIC
jgi:hypothetical protein